MRDAVEFDPAVVEWDGAMIPRRPLQEPHGSAVDWRGTGVWDDGELIVEMWRNLQTDHPVDTKQLEPGGVYTWNPAVYHGAGKRWHWVGYPYKLGLGARPEYRGEHHVHGTTELVAEKFTGDEPNCEEVPTYTIPLVFPGLIDRSDPTSDDHKRAEEIRNAGITILELYEKDPESFIE